MKKMMAALLVAGIAMIPVGVYAANSIDTQDAKPAQSAAEEKFGLADNVYGSFATLKQAVPSSKMEDYKRLNDKLTAAKAQLGDAEYTKFEALLKQLAYFTLNFTGDNGQIDTSKMTAEQLASFQDTIGKLQPYFEQLNG